VIIILSLVTLVFAFIFINTFGVESCGNKICDSGESRLSCSIDCGCRSGYKLVGEECVQGSFCGDGVCNADENYIGCFEDCGKESNGLNNSGLNNPTGVINMTTNVTGNVTIVCGDNICDDGEDCSTCGDCSCEIGYQCAQGTCVDITTPMQILGNPFALHGVGNTPNKVNELQSDVRFIATWYKLNNELIMQLDDFLKKTNQRTIISFDSSTSGEFNYPLLSDEQRGVWKETVGAFVERYDGDDDLGCIMSSPDCYGVGDGLYPDETLQNALEQNPIKYWQVENEWLSQIRDPADTNLKPSKEALLSHFIEIRNEIKEKDSEAKIIMGALGGAFFTHYDEGYNSKTFIEAGTSDCTYEKLYFSADENRINEIVGLVAGGDVQEYKEKVEYLLKEGAPYYDILDVHYYGNQLENVYDDMGWLNDNLEKYDIENKEVWALEYGVPYFFFPLMGLEKPECGETFPYSNEIHSASIVKAWAVGIHSGISKMFYSSLYPTVGWGENFLRLSLMDVSPSGNSETKKPAYYTFKLLREKLDGAENVRKLSSSIYQFDIEGEGSVFILWDDNQDRIVDISSEISSSDVKITYIVSELDNGEPVYPSAKIVPVSAVPITDIPIFVEEY